MYRVQYSTGMYVGPFVFGSGVSGTVRPVQQFSRPVRSTYVLFWLKIISALAMTVLQFVNPRQQAEMSSFTDANTPHTLDFTSSMTPNC